MSGEVCYHWHSHTCTARETKGYAPTLDCADGGIAQPVLIVQKAAVKEQDTRRKKGKSDENSIKQGD